MNHGSQCSIEDKSRSKKLAADIHQLGDKRVDVQYLSVHLGNITLWHRGLYCLLKDWAQSNLQDRQTFDAELLNGQHQDPDDVQLATKWE